MKDHPPLYKYVILNENDAQKKRREIKKEERQKKIKLRREKNTSERKRKYTKTGDIK